MLIDNVVSPTYMPLPTPTVAKASLFPSGISCVAWGPTWCVRPMETPWDSGAKSWRSCGAVIRLQVGLKGGREGRRLEKDSFAVCKDSTSCQMLLFQFTIRPQKAREGAGDQGLYKGRWAVKSRGCQTNLDVNPSGAVKNRACEIPLAPWNLRPRVRDYQFAASTSVKRTIPL